MSIADQITRIRGNISNAYDACNEKGATLPTTQNSTNLAATITSIKAGGTGTIDITTNGMHDVGSYASANVNVEPELQEKTTTTNGEIIPDDGYYGLSKVTVNVSGGSSDFIGIPREVSSSGVYSKPTENFAFTLPSNVKDVSNQALYYAFYLCPNLTSVDLSNLSTLSGSDALSNAFGRCTDLTSVDLSSLSTISGSSALLRAFSSCTLLTSVDLSNLSKVSGDSALQQAFDRCTNLKELSFPALTSKSFGLNTNQFNSMLYRVTGCTVHFPSNLESVIGSWSDVTSGFGGKSTQILFDLPATE